MRRRLFAELDAGPRRSADPTSFAAGLQIDHTIQQDGQEFLKLLLDLLQRRFAEADDPVRAA
jgi:ubiquitin carboxyl-terminal hydrolase 48